MCRYPYIDGIKETGTPWGVYGEGAGVLWRGLSGVSLLQLTTTHTQQAVQYNTRKMAPSPAMLGTTLNRGG